MPASDQKEKSKRSGLQRIVKGTDDLLKPLTDVTQKEFTDEAFASLGLVNVNIADIKRDKIDAFLNMEADKAGFLPFGEAMAQLTAIVEKLYDAIELNVKNFSGQSFEKERLVDDLTTALINILTMEWFRKVSPLTHNIFMILYSLNNFSNRGGGAVPVGRLVSDYFERWAHSFDLETAEEARRLSEFFFVIGTVMAFIGNSKLSDQVNREDIETELLLGGQYGSETAYKDKLESPRDFINELLGRAFTLSVSREKGTTKEEFLATLVMLSKAEGQSGVEVFLNKGFSIKSKPLSDNWFLSLEASGKTHFRAGGTNTDSDVDLSKSSLALAFERLVFEKNIRPEAIDIPEVFDFFQFGFGNISLQLEASPRDLTLRLVTQVTYATLKTKTVDGKDQKAGFPFKYLPATRNLSEIPLRYSIKDGFGFDGGFVGERPADKPAERSLTTGRALPEASPSNSKAGTLDIPIHRELGIVRFDKLHLNFDTEKGLGLNITLDFTLKFGNSVVISIAELGSSLNARKRTEKPVSGGFLGYDINPDFVPPKGAGLVVDAEIIKGGGFLYFNEKRGEYFGAIELKVKNQFDLNAIGIIRTRDNAGLERFSLLILVTADFNPIQLGLGFTLNGAGGLLGLNRRANVSYLQEGLGNGVLQNILFPRDVVANMSRILGELTTAFPESGNGFLVGLMAKIAWGTPTKITADIGVIVELPDLRVLVPGVLNAHFPTQKKAILKLQASFLGVLDFINQFVFFRADLIDSRLLTFKLTGSLALGISWDVRSVFVLSAGGFHPRFREIPSLPALPNAFRNMQRIGIHLLDSDNPRIVVEHYFAITSNTVQIGGKAEFFYDIFSGKGGYNIYGRLAVNALFHSTPFHFSFDIAAELALRDGTDWVLGIGVYGLLEGPTPWHLRVRAKAEIDWFPDIEVELEKRWGERRIELPPAVAEVSSLLRKSVRDVRNWETKIKQNASVVLRKMEGGGIPAPEVLRLDPSGGLKFSQSIVPLDFNLQKFGEQRPDLSRFSVKPIKIGSQNLQSSPVRELFAPDMFVRLTDDERLSRPSFERMTSGFESESSDALVIGAIQTVQVTGEISDVSSSQMTIPPKLTELNPHFRRLVRTSSATFKSAASIEHRARQRGYQHLAPKAEAPFVIVGKDDLKPVVTETFYSFSEAQQVIQKQVKTRRKILQVIETQEAM